MSQGINFRSETHKFQHWNLQQQSRSFWGTILRNTTIHNAWQLLRNSVCNWLKAPSYELRLAKQVLAGGPIPLDQVIQFNSRHTYQETQYLTDFPPSQDMTQGHFIVGWCTNCDSYKKTKNKKKLGSFCISHLGMHWAPSYELSSAKQVLLCMREIASWDQAINSMWPPGRQAHIQRPWLIGGGGALNLFTSEPMQLFINSSSRIKSHLPQHA